MRPEAEKPWNHRTSREAEKLRSREVRNKPRSREATGQAEKPRSHRRSREAEKPPDKPRSREATGQAEEPRSQKAQRMTQMKCMKGIRIVDRFNNQDNPLQQPACMTDLRNQNDRCRNQNDRFSNQNRVAIPKPTKRRSKDKRSDSKT